MRSPFTRIDFQIFAYTLKAFGDFKNKQENV